MVLKGYCNKSVITEGPRITATLAKSSPKDDWLRFFLIDQRKKLRLRISGWNKKNDKNFVNQSNLEKVPELSKQLSLFFHELIIHC